MNEPQVRKRKRAAVWKLYGFLSAKRRAQLLVVVALMILAGFAEVITIASVIPFIGLLTGAGEWGRSSWFQPVVQLAGSEQRAQITATLIFVAAAIVSGLVRLQLTWSSQRFVFAVGHELATDIQRRVLLQPYSYHIWHNSSEVMASLEEVQVFVSAVVLQFMYAAAAAVMSFFVIVALVQVDGLITVVAILGIAAVYGGLALTARRMLQRNSEIVGSAFQNRVRAVQESLGAIRDVILGQYQKFHLEAFKVVDRRFARARTTTAFAAAAPRVIVESAVLIFLALLTLTIARRDGSLDSALPSLGALALGAQRLVPLVQQLYASWASLKAHRSLTERIAGLLRLPTGLDENKRAGPLPFRDCVDINQISFTYPARTRPALSNVSLSIPRGSCVAFVGKSGSGKSTLADLLMGLLNPDSGQITVDGAILTPSNIRSWQMNIAHVAQTIFLADTTIAQNIAYGSSPDALDLCRVMEASRCAQLHDFVVGLPDAYNTTVGERGVRLSGGQRQRLGIARAIYKQLPVLVLDEATNALDQRTEAAVLHALTNRRAHTIIVIAHRVSKAFRPDVMLQLDN